MTVGVDSRVEQLSSHALGFKPENPKPFYKLLPLQELIALVVGTSMQSKRVWEVYNSLIEGFGNEFNILLNASKEELVEKYVDEKLVDLIMKNREQKLKVEPGYDGVYGKALLGEKQTTLI